MNLHPNADVAALEQVSTRLMGALGTVEDHHRILPTPCTDWDLAALVDHVVGGNWFTSLIVDGLCADEALNETRKKFNGANVTRERAVSSVGEQLAAFRRPGVLDRTHHHVVGDLTGRQVLRLRLHDLIVHNWDIDQTLAPPASVPPQLARWGLQELASEESLTARHFELRATPEPGLSSDIEASYLRRLGR